MQVWLRGLAVKVALRGRPLGAGEEGGLGAG